MNSLRIRIAMFLLVSFVKTTDAYSQILSDSETKKIDALFTKWNNEHSPGCAIGIVRNDSLIYSKGFGMANLEYNIPNTPATIFHMASVSKQFTGWAIILLARQGKLSLDDDIRKYLTWFPDLKEKITIRNLLNHTSGIRDQWGLLALSGTRITDVITQDHIIKILSKQQALNFKPGEQYSYSNSGFTMLAEIVKSVTGQTFRKFTDSAIFKPLGMNNTHFHDDYSEIVKYRSYSYNRIDSIRFSNSVLNYSNVGATSLFTNIDDMSKWVMNFYDHKVGDKKDVGLLTEKGKLNSGRVLSYACGISVDDYKGWTQYSHDGGDAGYTTCLSVFPDLKMGFIVFSNLRDIEASDKLYEMAELFIKDTSTKISAENKPVDSLMAVLKDTLTMKKFMGNYINEEGRVFTFEIKRGKLYCQVGEESHFLVKASRDTFFLSIDPTIKFIFSIKAKDTVVDIITPAESYYHLKKYIKNIPQTDDLLKTYAGIYYSPELDSKYGIVLKDHNLILTNAKHNDTKLTLINRDHLISSYRWISHIQILRDSKDNITGFEVNTGRIMHLRFNKIE